MQVWTTFEDPTAITFLLSICDSNLFDPGNWRTELFRWREQTKKAAQVFETACSKRMHDAVYNNNRLAIAASIELVIAAHHTAKRWAFPPGFRQDADNESTFLLTFLGMVFSRLLPFSKHPPCQEEESILKRRANAFYRPMSPLGLGRTGPRELSLSNWVLQIPGPSDV